MKKQKLISDPSQCEPDKPVIELFDEHGHTVDDLKKAFARTEIFDGKQYYFVLRNGFHVVNPLDGFTKKNCTMSIVSKECFDSYMVFLKTKKSVAYANAERLSHGSR